MIEERAWIMPASGRNRTGPIKALEKLCMASITLVFIGFAPHCFEFGFPFQDGAFLFNGSSLSLFAQSFQ